MICNNIFRSAKLPCYFNTKIVKKWHFPQDIGPIPRMPSRSFVNYAPGFVGLEKVSEGFVLCVNDPMMNLSLILMDDQPGFASIQLKKNLSTIFNQELLFLVLELLVVILLANFVRTMTFQKVVTKMHWLITHPLFRLLKQRINTTAVQLLIPITTQ